MAKPSVPTAFASVLILGLLPAAVGARTIDKTFSERFPVLPGHRLVLTHGDGDVRITPWSQDAIEIEVRYLADVRRYGPGSEGEFDVTFEQRGDTVEVIGHEPDAWVIGFFRRIQKTYEYRIQAPPWLVLELMGDDGEVSISGWRAQATIELDDGDLDLDDIAADVTVRGEDGEVTMRRMHGAVHIELDDGDILISESRVDPLTAEAEDGEIVVRDTTGRLRIQTDDGDIRLSGAHASRIETVTGDGNLEIGITGVLGALELIAESDDGDVQVSLAANIGVRFDVRMDDGDVDIDARGAAVEEDEHRVTGRIGDGSGRVRITTGDGNVTIRSDGR